MASLTLYALAPSSVPTIQCSPPSWAAQIALREVGAEHELVWLRFDRGEHRSERMLAINPAGSAPVLVDGELILTDTIEILEHIAGLGSGLAPGEATRRARARAVKETGMSALRAILTGSPPDQAWHELGAAIDEWCARGDVDAPELDVPGLLVFVYVVTAQSLGLDLARWPALVERVESLRQREAVVAAWPETW